MLDFQYPVLEDRAWMRPILSESGGMGNEYAFGTLFLWGGVYGSRYCRFEDFLLLNWGKDRVQYNFPIGKGDLKRVLGEMMEDARQRGDAFRMWGMTGSQCEQMEAAFPDTFVFTPDRDGSDYIYRSEDLIQLAGRKYHGKRNHLSRFARTYSFTYEDLGPDNLEACLEIAKAWADQSMSTGEKVKSPERELGALSLAIRHFDALALSGGLIRIDGKPAAFTIGEEINSKLFLLHFEKALSGYDGLYAAINHEFAARNLSGYEYINREEDMGIEGLRRAKLSYYPAILLDRYTAELRP